MSSDATLGNSPMAPIKIESESPDDMPIKIESESPSDMPIKIESESPDDMPIKIESESPNDRPMRMKSESPDDRPMRMKSESPDDMVPIKIESESPPNMGPDAMEINNGNLNGSNVSMAHVIDRGIRGLSNSDILLICSSDAAMFLIGPSKKEYHLPKALVTSLTNDNTLEDMFSNQWVIDWTYLVDEDLFNLFVQYAYTGDYKLPDPRMMEDEVIHAHQVYDEARKKHSPQDYWLYESSPHVQRPTPSSVLRCHTLVWNFARRCHIAGLEAVSLKKLREALAGCIRVSKSSDYFGMEEAMFDQVVDVVGYVYHQGRQYWGAADVKHETPLAKSNPMRLTVAWFARKYLCNRGLTAVGAQLVGDVHDKNLKTWAKFLRAVPLVALDIALCDAKKVPWTEIKKEEED